MRYDQVIMVSSDEFATLMTGAMQAIERVELRSVLAMEFLNFSQRIQDDGLVNDIGWKKVHAHFHDLPLNQRQDAWKAVAEHLFDVQYEILRDKKAAEQIKETNNHATA